MIDNLMSYARKMISAVILSAIVLSNIPIESVNAADGDFGVYTTQIDYPKLREDIIYIDADGNESECTESVPDDGVFIEAVPSRREPMIDEEFYVDFKIENNPGFSGYSFTVEFDPDIVEVDTDEPIAFYNEAAEVKYESEDSDTGEFRRVPAVNGATVKNAVARAENGKFSFVGILMSLYEAGVAQDNGIMFRVPFRVKAIGSAKIALRSYNGTMLLDKEAKTLSAYIRSTVVNVREEIKVTGITLDKTNAELAKGATLKLNANVTPDDADNKDVVWKSSDSNVASVDSYGNVKGIGYGTAVITARTSNENCFDQCTITIKPYDNKFYYDENPEYFYGVDSIPEDELCIEAVPSKSVVKYGEEFYVDFKIKNNPGFSSYSFSVNYNGYVVQPVASKIAEMNEAVEVKYTAIDPETEETVCRPAINVIGIRNAIQKAEENQFSWGDVLALDSSNLGVADNNGVMFRVYFEAVGEGKSNICIGPRDTLFLANQIAERMPVYVQNSSVEVKEETIPVPDTDISINEENVEMSVGTFRALSVESAPGGGSIAKEDIVWTSSDPSIASVYDDGTVLAHKTGTVVITAEVERAKAPAQCGVTVTERTDSSQYDIGDVDKDGYVTAKDAACVLRKALDSSYEYPPSK